MLYVTSCLFTPIYIAFFSILQFYQQTFLEGIIVALCIASFNHKLSKVSLIAVNVSSVTIMHFQTNIKFWLFCQLDGSGFVFDFCLIGCELHEYGHRPSGKFCPKFSSVLEFTISDCSVTVPPPSTGTLIFSFEFWAIIIIIQSYGMRV